MSTLVGAILFVASLALATAAHADRSFRIERSLAESGPFVEIGQTSSPANTCQFEDSNAVPLVPNYYRVQEIGQPWVPCELRATAVAPTQINLWWMPGMPTIEGIAWPSRTTMQWVTYYPCETECDGVVPSQAITYQVARGTIGQWDVSSCWATVTWGQAHPSTSVVTIPPPSTGWWFLVRGDGCCGTGEWGDGRTVDGCGP